MDLAQSILKELITLQKKNEELARIITKLEHESDVIIQQFEGKIEELQKNLKHEQDEKSRSARRYESEIKELEGSKDALILETANVRETYQSMIDQLTEKVRILVSDLEKRETEFTAVLDERDRKLEKSSTELATLRSLLQKQEEDARSDHELLSKAILKLEETLRVERDHTNLLISEKEREISSGKESLLKMNTRLRDVESERALQEEQTRQTIENLHHLINTERQIRTRELKERDSLVKKFESDLNTAERKVRDYDTAIQENESRYQEKISLLQKNTEEKSQTISDLVTVRNDLTSKIYEFEQNIKKLEEESSRQKKVSDDQIRVYKEDLISAKLVHETVLRSKDEQLDGLHQKTLRNQQEHQAEVTSLRDSLADITRQKSDLESSHKALQSHFQGLSQDKKDLEQSLSDTRSAFEHEMNAIRLEKDQIQKQVYETERELGSKIDHLREDLERAVSERDKMVSTVQERDDYYRDQISLLNREISELQVASRHREEELLQGQIQRDRHVNDLSTNNEALRFEVDRVRTQYLKLQETIRAEKEESVHALYRELTALEDRMHEKDREIASLSEKVLRLDAENTRLVKSAVNGDRDDSNDKSQVPGLAKLPVETFPPPVDSRRREVGVLTAHLEDPARAAEAAEALVGLGNDIVDLLIPLLHTGSIQRRVWIAVVLYEINDNRATLPLMKLLETPKVHFRELIWEAKNQLHTRSRTGVLPVSEHARAGRSGSGPNGRI